MAITPHIVVRDAERAVAFYREAFAAEELSRIPTPDARLMSVQLRIGDGLLHLADQSSRSWVSSPPPSIGGTPVVLALDVPDAEAAVHPGGGGGRDGASAVAGGLLGAVWMASSTILSGTAGT